MIFGDNLPTGEELNYILPASYSVAAIVATVPPNTVNQNETSEESIITKVLPNIPGLQEELY